MMVSTRHSGMDCRNPDFMDDLKPAISGTENPILTGRWLKFILS